MNRSRLFSRRGIRFLPLKSLPPEIEDHQWNVRVMEKNKYARHSSHGILHKIVRKEADDAMCSFGERCLLCA